jgi:uncharacterized membrane protein (UPF0127 family)
MKRRKIDVIFDGEKNSPFSFEVDEAETFFERARGLIGRVSPSPGCGFLIPKCNAIHTFFMSYAIDAYFLDSAGRVVKIVKGIKPWKLFIWGTWRAKKVIETAAGALPDFK